MRNLLCLELHFRAVWCIQTKMGSGFPQSLSNNPHWNLEMSGTFLYTFVSTGFFWCTSVCVCFHCLSYPDRFVEDGLFECREPVGTGDHSLGFLDPVRGLRNGDLVWRLHCGTSPSFWRQLGLHLPHWLHQCRDLPRSGSVLNLLKTCILIKDWSDTLYKCNVQMEWEFKKDRV